MEKEKIIKTAEKYGYVDQPFMNENHYSIYANKCTLDLWIREDSVSVAMSGYGACQPLIAKSLDELNEVINCWIRNR